MVKKNPGGDDLVQFDQKESEGQSNRGQQLPHWVVTRGTGLGLCRQSGEYCSERFCTWMFSVLRQAKPQQIWTKLVLL